MPRALTSEELLAQTQQAALDYADNLHRLEADALVLELAAPIHCERSGAKPSTDQQPGLFGPQQKGLFS
mgnify:CR=1 FL=1